MYRKSNLGLFNLGSLLLLRERSDEFSDKIAELDAPQTDVSELFSSSDSQTEAETDKFYILNILDYLFG